MLATFHEPRIRTRRDEAAEELERALNESLQPDFLAEIVAAENRLRQLTLQQAQGNERIISPTGKSPLNSSLVDEDDDADIPDISTESSVHNDVDMNADVPICNLPERMLLLMLEFLDEDSVGLFSSVCHRFHATACQDCVWSMMCRRVYSVQTMGRPVLLRRYKSWAHMFLTRPRVKYHGYYVLRTSYYKKPEWNMWSDLPKNAIVQSIYYRYFNFRRDGRVLYSMTHLHPREMFERFRHPNKDVYVGSYYIQKGDLHVVVNVAHSILQFIFRVTSRWRAPNTRLVLQSHALFDVNDVELRYPHYFDTSEEEFNFRRGWLL